MARPQEFDTGDTLYKVLGIFWRKGYEATSMADVLRATGLSKSSLYGTFGGKRDLFLAAFDLYREDRERELNLVLGQGTAREAIERYFRLIIADAGRREFANGCMSINQAVELAPHDPDVRRRVQDDFNFMERAFVATIARGQDEGSVSTSKSPVDLAHLLMISFPGFQVMMRAEMGADWLDRALGSLLSKLD